MYYSLVGGVLLTGWWCNTHWLVVYYSLVGGVLLTGWWCIKAGLHGQFYLPALCLPSTADKNGDAFTRQTCDLNKYSCVELSCVGGEFRVQHQYVSCC